MLAGLHIFVLTKETRRTPAALVKFSEGV